MVSRDYRPPDQVEPAGEAFFLQLQAGIEFAGSCPSGGLQTPLHLLEKYHSELQAI